MLLEAGHDLDEVAGPVALHGGDFQFRSKLREGTEAVAVFPPQRVMEELPPVPQEHRMATGGGYRRSA